MTDNNPIITRPRERLLPMLSFRALSLHQMSRATAHLGHDIAIAPTDVVQHPMTITANE